MEGNERVGLALTNSSLWTRGVPWYVKATMFFVKVKVVTTMMVYDDISIEEAHSTFKHLGWQQAQINTIGCPRVTTLKVCVCLCGWVGGGGGRWLWGVTVDENRDCGT